MSSRDRDIDQLQGHWLLARLGKKVLRPGGRKMTEWVIDRAGLTGARVVELAPGLGITAEEILRRAPGSYTGIDEDAGAVDAVGRIIDERPFAGRARVKLGQAQATGLDDGCADAVVAEAMLTMHGDKGKAAILDEVRRILAPGGRYAIHELALRPDDIDPAIKDSLRRDMSTAIRVNARPLTVAEWTALLDAHGFDVEEIRTDEMGLLKPAQMLADEGAAGVARIAANIARNPAARRRVMAMRKVFADHDDILASIGIIARVRDGGGEIEFLSDSQKAELPADGASLTFHDVLAGAPAAGDGDGPAVSRLQTADGVNLIAMRFRAGQILPDHRATHPITVQCMEGRLRFTVGDRTETLTPGCIAHLPAMVPHRVDADEDSVFLLSMLT